MISSLLLCNHRNLGAGRPSLIKLVSVSLFLIRSRGASRRISLIFIFMFPSLEREKEVCRDLPIRVAKNNAFALLALVISVFSSLRLSFRSAFRNSRILFRMFLASSREPLIPIIQSSAYLTYTNLLKVWSKGSLRRVCNNCL